MEARRNNTHKVKIELIEEHFMTEVAKVLTMGAEKYDLKDLSGNVIDSGQDNWKKGMSWRRTFGSALRHLYKWLKGEKYDYDWPPEILEKYGPTLHLANAAVNIMFLMHFENTSTGKDDRPGVKNDNVI